MNHLIGPLLARAAGIELTHMPDRGSAAAMADVMGGQIPGIMESVATAMGHIRGGRMRPLATSGAERSPAPPDVPTFAEAGFPGATSTNWFGFSAAAGIPAEVAARWEREIGAALASEPVRARFASIGIRPGTLDAAGYTGLIRSELDRWRGVIRAADIGVD